MQWELRKKDCTARGAMFQYFGNITTFIGQYVHHIVNILQYSFILQYFNVTDKIWSPSYT